MKSEKNLTLRAIFFFALSTCAVLFICVARATAQQTRRSGGVASKAGAPKTAQQAGGEPTEAELDDELDGISVKKPVDRVRLLKEFLQYEAPPKILTRAREMLVASYAALGDEKLQAGDVAGGVADFKEAIRRTPEKPPADDYDPNDPDKKIRDSLFVNIIAQLPSNLFLRGEKNAAVDVARAIEAKASNNPQRLLALAAFYLSIEQPTEAARLADAALKLNPNLPAVYQARGAADRVALRLDDAARDYSKALELDPKAVSAKRNLADIKRALGQPGEALTLYRALLDETKPDVKEDAPLRLAARTGLILSLFDLNRELEAETELKAALKEDSRNLPLLVGSAYWFASRNQNSRALELARRAVVVEPRYTWGHIALARALVGLRDPVNAERSLRYAQQYGRFPTLTYELANALAAAGFYDEAAEELTRSFALRGDQIETRLAGSQTRAASNFIELLAPERRAAIFEPSAADTEENARRLKSLLAFYLAFKNRETTGANGLNDALAAADFVAGDDDMSAFRQMYVASRLLTLPDDGSKAIERRALALTEMAARGSDAALASPVAATAALADDLRELRAQNLASGTVPDAPGTPRTILSNIFRGRIEDVTGWALYNDNNAAEAVLHLKRAVSVLPESTEWWRDAEWHLGAALDATGDSKSALAAYLKSYSAAAPNPVRRAILEAAYKKVNGSLEGLDEKIGAAENASSDVASAQQPASPAVSSSTAPPETIAAAASLSKPRQTQTNAPAPPQVNLTSPSSNSLTPGEPDGSSTPRAASTSPSPNPATANESAARANAASPSSDLSNAPSVNPTPSETPAPARSETAAPANEAKAAPASETNAAPTNEAKAASNESAAVRPSRGTRPRRVRPASEQSSSESGAQLNEQTNAQTGDAARCAFSLSAPEIEIAKSGGTQIVTVSYEGAASDITASTPNWSDVVVLSQPPREGEKNSVSFAVSSVSARTGEFKVVFKTPCGVRELKVTVKD